jgi:hypothetical protein
MEIRKNRSVPILGRVLADAQQHQAPVPLSSVGTRSADRRLLAPIIAAKLELRVRSNGPQRLTIFRPAGRHDPPNRTAVPISPIEAPFVLEGESSRSNFGEFLEAKRNFTFYTRLDESGDNLHSRAVVDRKKWNGQLCLWGKKEVVSWKKRQENNISNSIFICRPDAYLRTNHLTNI